MDVYNPIGSSGPFSSISNSSEFHDDAYLEYRSRVFEELAADYDKENCQMEKTENKPDELNVNYQPANNIFLSTQPQWDDSDLLEETYVASTQRPSKSYQGHTNYMDNSLLQSEQFSHPTAENKPLMNWSAIDKCINQIDKKSNSLDSVSSIKSKANSTELIYPSWSGKKNVFQEQKLKREAIRRKLSLGESEEEEEEDFTSEKSWPKFSANSESLHICYINNNSCSSDSEPESSDVRHPNSSFSPISSPSFTASRILAKKYTRSNLPPDPSVHSSSSSNSSMRSDNSLLQKIEGASPSKEMNERELEVRFELAQAHQRAKKQAEEERRKERLTLRTSLAHRLLSDTLPEDTATKMKSYSLTRDHCHAMTIGQLQLILNDMHAKKQALNEKLVHLLIDRDALQTEQDAKLVDVEDAKSMLDAAGPETTV